MGQELNRLEASGILEQVKTSNWAAPIVSVPKKDSRICICGDYKVTINPSLEVDVHPLPRMEELFAAMVRGGGAEVHRIRPYQCLSANGVGRGIAEASDN